MLRYLYDMGDDWEHEIEFVGINEAYTSATPCCIMGVGDAPPEDVGGIGGYAEFRKILSDPEHVKLILTMKKEGGVPAINRVDLINLPILVPPYSEQIRVVSILDRFETFCNNISAGLPAEITARQKQYEYYRDKLLTFKEATV